MGVSLPLHYVTICRRAFRVIGITKPPGSFVSLFHFSNMPFEEPSSYDLLEPEKHFLYLRLYSEVSKLNETLKIKVVRSEDSC